MKLIQLLEIMHQVSLRVPFLVLIGIKSMNKLLREPMNMVLFKKLIIFLLGLFYNLSINYIKMEKILFTKHKFYTDFEHNVYFETNQFFVPTRNIGFHINEDS